MPKRDELRKIIVEELNRQNRKPKCGTVHVYCETETEVGVDGMLDLTELVDAIMTHATCLHADYCKGDCLWCI